MSNKENSPLDLAIKSIEKQFGKGSILTLKQDSLPGVEWISTGCLSLDRALGGGFAKGRIAEIFGPESSGKTTVALSAIAQAQKNGGTAAFIDAEHAIDPVYANNLGVDVENLLLSQPSSGEEALEIAEKLSRSGALDIVVVDSVAALTPKAQIEGTMEDNHVGIQARLMSQALGKLSGAIWSTGTCIIFINQLRMKIGVMFGTPETTSGGNALKFYSSQRLEVRGTSNKQQDGEDITARESIAKVVKNKVAPPFKKTSFYIKFGKGIDSSADLLRLAVESGVIQKRGAWYYRGEEKVGHGHANAVQFIEENEEVASQIAESVNSA